MTTLNSSKKAERETQEMLGRATPAQIARLLVDIMTAPPVKTEPTKYDA
jgi:hypothetical protein